MTDGQTTTSTDRTDQENKQLPPASEDELDLSHLERDLENELEDGRAGSRGVLLDAQCTECRLTRAKRSSEFDADDPDLSIPFKHFCHECGSIEWWHPVRALEGNGEEP